MNYSMLRVVVLLLPALFFSGCASIPPQILSDIPKQIPDQYQIRDVPFIQQDDYQCGASTLAMVLHYLSHPVPVEQLSSMVYSPGQKGSLQPFMLTAVRRQGFIGVEIDNLNALLTEISNNNPVIILQNNGLSFFPKWHYALVTGFDQNRQQLTLHSGSIENYQLDWSRFYQTWQRSHFWGLVVTPPEKIPASTTADTLFLAASALEQAGYPKRAATAYQALLKKWPAHLETLLAVANLHYASQDLNASRRVLQQAVISFPGSAAAHNNLAQVLLESNELSQALRHARIAVKLGGPYLDTARQTLADIERIMHKGTSE